jgi:lipopolysaccharide heptosyltransferase II
MATPVLAALRRAYPQARLDFAVGEWSAPALAHNSHLSGLVDCGLVGSGRRYPLAQYRALVDRVRRAGYDWCLILERSAVVGLVPWLAGVRHRIGLDSGGRGFAHTVRVPVVRGRHEAETYLDVVRAAGVPVEDPRLEFYPTEQERARAVTLLPDEGRWLAIHPGGGTNPGMSLTAKRWPADRFAAIAGRTAAAGMRVALVGAAYDAPLAEEVERAVEARARPAVSNLAGKTTLGELGAVLERCAAFLGNDTGAMHLAVAVGTPPVALFGPTDPAMYGPYRLGEAVSAGLPCSPCFVDGRAPDCAGPRCMEAITVDEVWNALQQVLGSREGTQ